MEYERKYEGDPLIDGYDAKVTAYTLHIHRAAQAIEVVVFTVSEIGERPVKVRMTVTEATALASHFADAIEQVQA